MSLAEAVYAPPVIESPIEERVSYLRKVGVLVFLGLGTSVLTGAISAGVFIAVPSLLSGYFPMIIALGCWGIAQYALQPVVFNSAPSVKTIAFFAASGIQGIAMGMLFLFAALLGAEVLGNPLAIPLQAFAIVGATALGMMIYLMTGPRELSMVRSILAVLWLPMLVAMAVTWLFPIGGIMGLGISFLFVGVSALGLLYQLNQVIHKLSPQQSVEGAYLVTMALLVLLWNVMTLLMRLQSRD